MFVSTKRTRAVAEILGEADLDDERLSRRLEQLTSAIAANPAKSLARAVGSEAEREGAYRFLRNDGVKPEAVLLPYIEDTAERVGSLDCVYVVSDTTELRFSGEAREGLGWLQNGGQGFLSHACLAVAADGSRLPLGLLSHETIVRGPKRKKRRGTKLSRKADDRESLKWIRGVEACNEALAGRTKVIHLMDREADIYDLLARLVLLEVGFAIRVAQNRVVLDDDDETVRLFDALNEAGVSFKRNVPLSRRTKSTRQHPARKEREAKLSVASKCLTLQRPTSADCELPPALELNFVHVFEQSPPEGEKPIDWKIVTTEPISTRHEIESVIDAYRARWVIEEFFKALKTGCAMEQSQLESIHALQNLLAIKLPIAVQLLALRTRARSDKKALALGVLTALQLEVLRAMGRTKLSANPTASDALAAIAALGGHIKNNGSPGWQVLTRGFEDLVRYCTAWAVFKSLPSDVITH